MKIFLHVSRKKEKEKIKVSDSYHHYSYYCFQPTFRNSTGITQAAGGESGLEALDVHCPKSEGAEPQVTI